MVTLAVESPFDRNLESEVRRSALCCYFWQKSGFSSVNKFNLLYKELRYIL
jgi:hypothetical protein